MTTAQAEARIRRAWIAGAAAAVMTLFASLLPLAGISLAGFNLWNLADAVLIAGLAFGISRRSRVCAVVMLVYFVASIVMLVARTTLYANAAVEAIFVYFYIEGVRGAFAWHSLAKAGAAQPPPLAP
jgi:hypothetical protein